MQINAILGLEITELIELHRSSYGAVSLVSGQKNTDNTVMLWLLLNNIKAFSVSHYALPVNKL